MRETVEAFGAVWYRYPESNRRSDRAYFRRHERGKPIYLHRYVWEQTNGPIPKKHHIHHKDENTGNNSLENLELATGAAHLSKHMRDRYESAPEVFEQRLVAARLAAPEWHASPEGRAWHSEHGKRVAANKTFHACKCKVCGADFESKTPTAGMCSAKCRAKDRRNSGKDDIEFVCAECNVRFTKNRFQVPKFCSRSCNSIHNNRNRADRRVRSERSAS